MRQGQQQLASRGSFLFLSFFPPSCKRYAARSTRRAGQCRRSDVARMAHPPVFLLDFSSAARINTPPCVLSFRTAVVTRNYKIVNRPCRTLGDCIIFCDSRYEPAGGYVFRRRSRVHTCIHRSRDTNRSINYSLHKYLKADTSSCLLARRRVLAIPLASPIAARTRLVTRLVKSHRSNVGE